MLNKIYLPGADPERVRREIEEIIGLDCSEAILCSTKEVVFLSKVEDSDKRWVRMDVCRAS